MLFVIQFLFNVENGKDWSDQNCNAAQQNEKKTQFMTAWSNCLQSRTQICDFLLSEAPAPTDLPASPLPTTHSQEEPGTTTRVPEKPSNEDCQFHTFLCIVIFSHQNCMQIIVECHNVLKNVAKAQKSNIMHQVHSRFEQGNSLQQT